MPKDIFDYFLIAIGLLVVCFIGFIMWLLISHANGIQAGYVYKKDYDPPRDYTTSQTINNGKTTSTIYTPHHENEKFSLLIQQTDDKGERKTNWVYVPQDIWNRAKVGQWFDANCMCFPGR